MSTQSASGSKLYSISGALMPTLLSLSRRLSGCTRFGRSGTSWVARAVARRSRCSTSTGPPSTRASLPYFTYQRGTPVSAHIGRRSALAASQFSSMARSTKADRSPRSVLAISWMPPR